MRWARRLLVAYRAAERFHDAFFVGRWRAGLQREARRQEDAFLALLYLDSLGVESPVAYYTLELYPHVAESFHQWHRRLGMDRFPDPGVCC